ncbi:hypothetical protein [uncultured Polaribacter sp.]|uniref:DUF6913 domain-containing protein n=1 Tax=uncultured Polaribacter sp. TaxID=174711 RepID=UPI002610A4F7|nr:hypothetical protein [uncultured Polaribacter sp.]
MISILKIKEVLIKKQFRKTLIEKENNRVVCHKEIKSVGILTTEEISKNLNVKDKVEEILGLKNAKIYSYKPQIKKEEVSFVNFSEIDFKWNGQVAQPNFKSFIDEPFDLLIGFFNKENLYLENAVLQSNAKFKVGLSKVNQQLFDIEFDVSVSNIEKFLQELKKYLLILKKLKN